MKCTRLYHECKVEHFFAAYMHILVVVRSIFAMRRFIHSFVVCTKNVVLQVNRIELNPRLDSQLSLSLKQPSLTERYTPSLVLVNAGELDEDIFYIFIINKRFCFSYFTLRYANSISNLIHNKLSLFRLTHIVKGMKNSLNVLVYRRTERKVRVESGKWKFSMNWSEHVSTKTNHQHRHIGNVATGFFVEFFPKICVGTFVEIYRFYGRKEKRRERKRRKFSAEGKIFSVSDVQENCSNEKNQF